MPVGEEAWVGEVGGKAGRDGSVARGGPEGGSLMVAPSGGSCERGRRHGLASRVSRVACDGDSSASRKDFQLVGRSACSLCRSSCLL